MVLVAIQLLVLGLYLPPVFKVPPSPPQMIISLPVHIAVWVFRPGADHTTSPGSPSLRVPHREATAPREAGPRPARVIPALIFSADETTDIGDDYGMPVSADYAGASRFNGPVT